MQFQGFLGCLLLALCLGSREARPLPSGRESVEAGIGETVGRGIREAVNHAAGEAAGKGVEEAVNSGPRDAVGSETGDAIGHRVGETIYRGPEEAAHAVGNAMDEAGRQAESIIHHGIDTAHGSWQGRPGSNGAWGPNGHPPSGAHGIFGSQDGFRGHSQGNPGGPGDKRPPRGSDGSFGTDSQGGPWGQGGYRGSHNLGTNAQGPMAQPGYESVRRGNQNVECTNPPPSGSGGSSSNSGGGSGGSNGCSGGSNGGSGGSNGSSGGSSNGSSGGSSNGGSGGSNGSSGGSNGSSGSNWGSNTGFSSGSRGGNGGGNKPENSQTSPGLFNFNSLWRNLKSKLPFINWDAIDKSQVPPPSTRALLYFSRLWEDFKHNTPFLNWKAIIEGAEASSPQKRAAGAGQLSQSGHGWQEGAAVTSKNYNHNQQANPTAYDRQSSVKTPAKGGATISSSASRVQPGLLQWAKFW
ncbi:dermokine [Choloepus didactylus]|uniref:dermokine n=1 Tax=Choloepus didactylus TaxID=27675 RepID=UPI00189F3BA7|nr:dermokine [Choloepus didactylus]